MDRINEGYVTIRMVDEPSLRSRWVWIVAATPALLVVHWIGPQQPAPLSFTLAFTLLGIIPFALATAFGLRHSDLGLGWGNARLGVAIVAIGTPLAVIGGYVGAQNPEIRQAYPLDPTVTTAAAVFAIHALLYLLYYVGFDFFFRGFLLFGLLPRFGPRASNLFQAGLATLVHVGKPTAELIAAFPASLLFGYVTLRTGSIWYAVLGHWIVGVAMDWVILR